MAACTCGTDTIWTCLRMPSPSPYSLLQPDKLLPNLRLFAASHKRLYTQVNQSSLYGASTGLVRPPLTSDVAQLGSSRRPLTASSNTPSSDRLSAIVDIQRRTLSLLERNPQDNWLNLWNKVLSEAERLGRRPNVVCWLFFPFLFF